MLAIAGGKGGVGKTTTTLALAATLGNERRPVRVVDVDCDMPDLHTLAGCDREPTLAAVRDGGPLADQEVRSYPGVRLVGAPARSGCAGAGRFDVVAALRTLDDGDRLTTLVDTPGGAGPPAVDPLRAAEATVLVSDSTQQSLLDAAKTAAMARQLDTRVVGVVLTRTQAAPSGVADLLDTPVLATVPSARRPLNSTAVWSAYDTAAQRLSTQTII
ncbi:P-loop NTPase [Haloarchaeobius sp. HME9146]|uniref:MinD/ParA family ATP-binding protein n=1 Tax=Haloarchaeobius sp. HME9146 TaxID=2978732 RepID=UPI0021BF8589|nr:P-loop NTPase [Haloarchaeobius sp. HME9146]MCT9096899.1 P-loop NTPase [Haloarchaeobius sp. HME9146]